MKKVGNKYGYDAYLLFTVFDFAKNGYLQASDIYKTFSEIGLRCELQDIESAFDEMDLDHNERISLKEFCLFMEDIEI